MEEQNLSNSFYEANNMLIPKLHKDSTNETKQNKQKNKKTLQTNISHEFIHKNPQWDISKSYLAMYKKIIHHDRVGFIPNM